ncbi:PadR family transcriptional regulator [Paenibacillus andongensis]|uniref:PadR family transcriptional regulator n=1 Tax=Paenibacillus andongensis TaxID=2975482 RepID=UPI0021BA7526|nr:PadR family transcriptional regulator [Paenibacillus andongensis]
MSSIRYALLTLLAREPLSGYDIKQQMNSRIGPFWKVGSNQVYPELSKMEAEGLVALQTVEQLSYRPARKLYEITEVGREALIQWTLNPEEVENVRDDFLLKAYNSWLIEPEKMIIRIEEKKKQHQERLTAYLDKVAELTQLLGHSKGDQPLDSSISVVEFGIEYERMYMDWCDKLIEKLQKIHSE